MAADDRVDAAGDKLKGNVKEAYGNATGDDSKVAEGQADQAKGHLKDAVEDVKDVFKK